MRASRWILTALLAGGPLVVARPSQAQFELGGQLDLSGTLHADSVGLNTNFHGDSPFDRVRLRLFARRWINDRIGIFTELLYDVDAPPRVNGAYVVVNELGGLSWLNTRLGLAPNIIGTFGLRSTYFNSNPLMGVPLVWYYRTNLSGAGTSTAASLSGATSEPAAGLPLLYEACWNIQWEVLGEVGPFEYSLGVTPGSLSNPIRARSVPGSMWLGRVGYAPIPAIRLGVSAARGPYLSKPEPDPGTGALPYTENPSDFDQTLLGGDLQYQGGPWLFYTELYDVRWDTPLVDERLEALGGYAELRFDFLPGWYVAGRVGGVFFNDIASSPGGAQAPWDHDARRTEFALGYRFAREVLLKLDWQRTTVPDADFEQNIFAAQLSSVF